LEGTFLRDGFSLGGGHWCVPNNAGVTYGCSRLHESNLPALSNVPQAVSGTAIVPEADSLGTPLAPEQDVGRVPNFYQHGPVRAAVWS
jgi:hypothetical protein